MLRRAVPLISVALALAATACTSSSTPKAAVTPPADALATLAAQGASAVYTATYAFHQVSPDTTATVKVWRAEPSLRVDVVAGNATATLLRTPAGSYSCSIAGAKRSCLLVARPGAPVPAPFDVAPANLFSADLHTLATDTASYDVRSAPVAVASGAPPTGEVSGEQCFDISSSGSSSSSPSATPSPSAAVPTGRYCFTSAGVLATAKYPSGNTITLTALQTSTPAPDAFTPYAKPTPLPS